MGSRRQPSDIRIVEGLAYVSLTKGLEAIVDLDDVPLISEYKWHALVGPHGHAYAARSISRGSMFMHRFLMDPPKGMYVDHVDGDGLNNRRCNIRVCTPSQNQANLLGNRRSLIGLKGVSPLRGRYHARITSGGRTIHLGIYDTPEEASAAYNGAAKVLWGEFAKN